jgi:hypothetical protein
VADDLDRELGDILRAEASQWSPVNLDETRRILPERVARRRRHQAVTGATIIAAVLVVALVAAAPGGGRDAAVQLAGPVPRTAVTSPGAGNSPAPGGGSVCQAACGARTPVGTPTSANLGPTVSGPRQGRAATTGPVTRPNSPSTVPQDSIVPPTVVVTSVPPTTTPPPPATLHIFTEADRGLTVDVNAHDGILLNLGAQCPGAEWSEPVASDAAVLQRLSASADPRAGTASAMFTAVTAGEAQITARVLRTPCMTVPLPFVLTIKVIGPSGNPSPTPKTAV